MQSQNAHREEIVQASKLLLDLVKGYSPAPPPEGAERTPGPCPPAGYAPLDKEDQDVLDELERCRDALRQAELNARMKYEELYDARISCEARWSLLHEKLRAAGFLVQDKGPLHVIRRY